MTDNYRPDQIEYRRRLIAVVLEDNPRLSGIFPRVDLTALLSHLGTEVLEKIAAEEVLIDSQYEFLNPLYLELPEKRPEFKPEVDYSKVDNGLLHESPLVEAELERIAQKIRRESSRSRGGRSGSPRSSTHVINRRGRDSRDM